MPSESVVIAFIAKFGFVKLFTLGAALSGAALMAVFRPPKSRKEMFLQATVALSCSFLFGDTVTHMLDSWLDFIDYATSPWEAWIQFSITIHTLMGALSWGFFGGLAHMRDKFANDPIQAAKDVKDLV